MTKTVADYKELLQQWDFTKNNMLPSEVPSTSNKKVWWKLPYYDHNTDKHFIFEWQSSVKSRVSGNGCPYLSKPVKAIHPGFNDLATTHPKLLEEWDYDKNKISPTEISAGSAKKVWWKKKHYDSKNNKYIYLEWEATIANRINGRNCPYLSTSNKKVLAGFNDLATTHPELIKEWNYEKNIISPTEVSKGSNKKVWWKLEYYDKNTDKNYIFEWEATINNRLKRGCPFLSTPARAVLPGFNDLATVLPKLIEEWDYDNNTILPTQVTIGSNLKVWWKCKKGHRWNATINSRNTGIHCPYCQNVSVLSGYNDLLSQFTDIAKEWDFTKNASSPKDVLYSSPSVVWWKCSKCGYEWKTSIRHRTQRHQNCPKCSDELKTSFGEQAIYYYISKIFPNTQNRFLFDKKREIDIFIPEINTGIEYDGIYFHKTRIKEDIKKESDLKWLGIKLYRMIEHQDKEQIKINKNTVTYSSRKKGELDLAIRQLFNLINIPYTEINTEKDYSKICQSYLTLMKKNSVTSSNLLKEWNFERNEGINPDFISLGSTKKVWWKCQKGHEWQATVGSRNHGNGCPICIDRKIIVGINDLVSTHPELLKEWNFEKNIINPTEVVAGSGKKVWWKCSKCNHEWQARIVDRAIDKKGCKKCSSKLSGKQLTLKIIKEKGSLCETHPYLLEEWSYSRNADITPNESYCGSHRKVWWKCSKCGFEWEAAIRNRAVFNRGCPKCKKI